MLAYRNRLAFGFEKAQRVIFMNRLKIVLIIIIAKVVL